MRHTLLAVGLALGVLLSLGQPVTPETTPDVRPVAEETASPFSLVVLPDTQHYSESDELADTARAQTQWVVDNRDDLNIAFTVQLGDLVASAQDTDQWDRISSAFETLDNNAVPYSVLPGDHDLDVATGEATAYQQAFPVSRFRDAAWNAPDTRFGGYLGSNAFGPDPVDRQAMNTFDLFRAGGVDWLLLNLEVESPDYVLDWAQKVVDAHPDRRVILTTHGFIDTRGWRTDDRVRSDAGINSSNDVWNEFVHRNCSIDFVLNGHSHEGSAGEARRTDSNVCGEPVTQALSNYEGRPDGGDGLLRYYTFDPAEDTVEAFTYSVTKNAFESDDDSRFTVPYDFSPDPTTIDDVTVPGGSTWKYRNQQGVWPTGWDSLTYDDSAWASGRAPLGFGGGMVRTDIDGASPSSGRSQAVLFRRAFDLDRPGEVSRLRLVTKADDGLVVRVNGQEVGRTSVPPGGVGSTTAATAAPRSMEAPEAVYDVPVTLLKASGNVIAASMHLKTLDTTDAHFDLVAVATRPRNTPTPPTTENVTLVENAAPWRWRFNTTAWPSTWTTPTYNDSTWAQGPAPLGFGAAVSTNIDVPPPTSNRPRSALFRRTFEIDDVNRYSGLQLTSRADDGVVLFVNGTEVNRTRLPTGTLSANSYATAAVSTSTATASPVTVQVPKSLLRNGTNVLAAATVLNYKATPNATFAGRLTAVRTTPGDAGASPPAAPALRVDSTTYTDVNLGWSPAQDDTVTGWTLARNGTTIAHLLPTARTYTDTGRSPGTTYTYSLTAMNTNGPSPPTTVNATTSSNTQPVTLVSTGSTWRHRYSPTWPTNWSAAAFDDSSWSNGRAPLGFGASSIATNIDVPPPTSNRPRSALFRTSFDVDDRSRLSNLVLATRADDGVVVYVNGRELGRSNVPTGTVSASTYASAAPRTSAGLQNPVRWSVPTSMLQDGRNTVAAVSLVNYKATPDLSFDLSLTGTRTTPLPPPPPIPGSSGSPGMYAPLCGALWGVYTLEGANPATAVTDLEAEVGRRFDVTLRYHDFSTQPGQGVFPDSYERTLGEDRILFMSWQARVSSTNTDLQWADIAAGRYDSFISSAATRLKAWNRPVIIAFDAEFDNLTTRKGPVADYVRAYRRIVDMFRAADVSNVAWAWVPTGYLGEGNDTRTLAGYPGDSYVDWVGYDPYNFFRCTNNRWKTFEETIAPTYEWLVNQGLGNKPFLLSEYGTQYDAGNPSASTQWYADMPGVLERYPNLKALIRYDDDGVVNSGARCGLWIDNGPGMKDAFGAAGRTTIFGFTG